MARTYLKRAALQVGPRNAEVEATVRRMISDIAENRDEAVRRYARDLEQSKEMFLAILGHDVRTPLGAIMMSATGLLMARDLRAPYHAAATRITRRPVSTPPVQRGRMREASGRGW